MKVKKQNEATPGVTAPRKLAAGAAVSSLTLPPVVAVSPSEGNWCDTANFREDGVTRTAHGRFTQSWNLRKKFAAYRFDTKARQGQERLGRSMAGIGNPSTKSAPESRGPLSRTHRLRPLDGGESSTQHLDPAIHLRQIETVPCPAVIEERNRMAREIHDTLAQEFAGILLHLEAINGLSASENASEYLARARELAKSGLENARRMLLGLRPKSLEGANLSDALGQLAKRFSRDCGIHCTFSASGQPQNVPEEIENELYRVAQEVLCNVRKHSRADFVSILLSYTTAGIVLSIKDNGQGFVRKQSEPGAHGFGLPVMCERADRLGGKMNINSGQGAGTEVMVSVPMSGKTSKERNDQ